MGAPLSPACCPVGSIYTPCPVWMDGSGDLNAKNSLSFIEIPWNPCKYGRNSTRRRPLYIICIFVWIMLLPSVQHFLGSCTPSRMCQLSSIKDHIGWTLSVQLYAFPLAILVESKTNMCHPCLDNSATFSSITCLRIPVQGNSSTGPDYSRAQRYPSCCTETQIPSWLTLARNMLID